MVNDTYRPEIDGLRAIAVSAVVLFHAGLGFPGGFVGVDIFFVISGFLVTGIIARSLTRGDFSLTDFYCRRIRRIFPAATVLTAAVLSTGYFLLLPSEYEPVGRAALAQNVFAANIFFWFDTGYFSRDVLTKPLLHFWSLAVEEQFYLLFPIALSLGFRAGGRNVRTDGDQVDRRINRLALGVMWVAVVSFMLSIYGTNHHPSATFYLLPTRAWELMAGAWLALRPVSPRRRYWAEGCAGVGALMIVVAIFMLSKESHFPGFVALLPVVGTMLVIAANTQRSTIVGRALSVRPVVFVGLISYSLYLWHWPLMALTRSLIREPSTAWMLAIVIASFALAAISWRWVEQPIRRRNLLSSNRHLLLFSGIAWIALLMGSLWIVRSNGIPKRFDGNQQALIKDAFWNGNQLASTTSQVEADEVPSFGSGDADERRFLLWGDSHAMTWTDVVKSACEESGRRGFATMHGGVPPLPGLSRTGMPQGKVFNEAVMAFIERNEITDVILVSRWSVYVSGYSDADPMFDGRRSDDVYLTDSDQPATTGEASLAAMVRAIEKLAAELRLRGVRLWLIRQVPVQASVVAENGVRNMLLGWDANPIRPTDLESHRTQQAVIEPLYAAAELAIGDAGGVLDPADLFLDEQGRGRIFNKGRYLYRDDDHLSYSGAKLLKPLVDRILQH